MTRKRTNATLVAGLFSIAPLLLAPKGCDAVVGIDPDGGRGAKCGGLNGAQCSADLFCNFASDAMCGVADAEGTCEPRPIGCDAVVLTVCGCDGYPYRNACEANAAGISVASQGECDGSGGGSGEPCGGLGGAQCPADEFCDFPLDALCGFADAMGTCASIPTTCMTDDNPVCGCDGATYGNACGAHRVAVSVDHEGPCP